ncbi:MAG: peptide ABC transporter substrate-binding protein [Cyanobacteria bacterium P01_H01_bin.74]
MGWSDQEAGPASSKSASSESVQDGPKKIFRMNLGTEPPTLDPAKMSDLTSFSVALALMKGLTQFDDKMQVVPAMADRWSVSQDGLTYRFHIRKTARWSDGQPVTANQFKYAWQRALSVKTAADYAFFLFAIKNAKAYYNQDIKDFNAVGIRVIDANTLVVELEHPTPFFTALTASPVFFPLRKDSLQRWGDDFTEAGHLISNGAYQLKRWDHEEQIVAVPNPYFYDQQNRPQVDAVTMLMINDANTSVVMYENNELDFIETTTSIPSFDVRRLIQKPEASQMPLHRIAYFGFNTQKPPFNNIKVRQAFAHALDRRYFPKLLQSGQTAFSGWISPNLVGYNPDAGLPYNPEKAKQLLAEAGYPGGKGFPEVKLTFPTKYDVQKEAEIAQFLWQKTLGVSVRLNNLEWKVMLSQLASEDAPALYRLGWFVDYPDADSFMQVFSSDSGNNYTGWHSTAYDALINQAVQVQKPQERQALYNQAQQLLLEKETVIVPVYLGKKTILVKPWVKGLSINPLNLPNYDRLDIIKK